MNELLEVLISHSPTIDNLISFLLLLAAVGQVLVTVAIARSLSQFGKKLDGLRAAQRINDQWQEFNLQVITNEDFRNTVVRSETADMFQDIQLAYLVFYKLNIMHDSFQNQRALGKIFHLPDNLEDQLKILANHTTRSIVLDILRGERGYDKEFADYCIEQIQMVPVHPAVTVHSSLTPL